MENNNMKIPGIGVLAQVTEQSQYAYDLSWLEKILASGLPTGGITDTPPHVFSYHNQFEEIGRRIADPSRDGGVTQSLAKEAAAVLIAAKCPALAAVARPLADTAVKALEVNPNRASHVWGPVDPPPGFRKMEQREPVVRREPPKPARKKGRGL